MRWSEAVTIYLAVGASFGVSHYLRAASRIKSRRRAGLEGLAAVLLWPLTAAAILVVRLRHISEREATDDEHARVRGRMEEAGRALLLSVNELLEAERASTVAMRETTEHTLYALRDGAEQYVELAGMQAEVDERGAPAAHEMELARLAGCRGEDLLLAGRCTHRRNVSRVHARHHRERTRLLRKLAELREEEGKALPSQPDEASGAWRMRMSAARLKVYERAVDLFSLVEDEGATRSAAQLMNAECATLRRLKVAGEEHGDATSPGEEKCTEHTHRLIYKDPLRATTFTRG
jgi:hypothetical protein